VINAMKAWSGCLRKLTGVVLGTLLLSAQPLVMAGAEQGETAGYTPYKLQIEQPFTMAGGEFDYRHQIQVALPASYNENLARRYPVLWLTDGSLTFDLAVGLLNALTLGNSSPEMIIVAVGASGTTGYEGFVAQRTMEFSPPVSSDISAQHNKKYYADRPELAALLALPKRADKFLAFLVDELRPQLETRYRMSGDHALFGHSFGGVFASYALLVRPVAFSKYLIGSPNLNSTFGAIFALEKQYAEDHADLDAAVFFAAGELELNSKMMAAGGVVGKMVELSDVLRLRDYESLRIGTRIFPGKDHFSVIADVLTSGVKFLWEQEIQALGPLLK